MNSVHNNTQWTEKYRPLLHEDLIVSDIQYKKICSYNEDNIPNILINGPPGTGKTTTALLIAKKLIINQDSFIELNASDNRGINMINDLVQNICKKRTNSKIKIILLDEADNITKKAQQQLINLIENYKNVRVILTCNTYSEIIEPIQSRCEIIEFKKMPASNILNRLQYICSNENVDCSDESLTDIIYHSNNDIRQCINTLEILQQITKTITNDIITVFCQKPIIYNILDMILHAVNKNLTKAIESYYFIKQNGLSNLDIMNSILSVIFEDTKFFRVNKKYKSFQNNNIKLLSITNNIYFKMNQTYDSDLLMISYIYNLSNIVMI